MCVCDVGILEAVSGVCHDFLNVLFATGPGRGCSMHQAVPHFHPTLYPLASGHMNSYLLHPSEFVSNLNRCVWTVPSGKCTPLSPFLLLSSLCVKGPHVLLVIHERSSENAHVLWWWVLLGSIAGFHLGIRCSSIFIHFLAWQVDGLLDIFFRDVPLEFLGENNNPTRCTRQCAGFAAICVQGRCKLWNSCDQWSTAWTCWKISSRCFNPPWRRGESMWEHVKADSHVPKRSTRYKRGFNMFYLSMHVCSAIAWGLIALTVEVQVVSSFEGFLWFLDIGLDLHEITGSF